MTFVGQFPIVLAQAMQGMPGMDDMPGMDHGADATLATIFDALVLSRWVHFATVFLLFGASFFWLTVGRQAPGQTVPDLPRSQRATVRLLAIAAPLAALSGLGWLLGMLANMTGGFGPAIDPENLRLFFFETAFGPVWGVRLILLAAAAVTALSPLRNDIRFTILGHAGALLLISQAWLGHAAEGGSGLYGAMTISVYCAHVCAGGAWVGGLPPLIFAMFETRTAGPEASRKETYEILSRYSAMASIAVTLLVLSGIANAWFRTAGSLGILGRTGYGAVLLAKIILVTAMLALAAFNRFIAMPRLRRGTPAGHPRASILVELGLGVLVVAAAAVLGITPPPQ
jgi:putative copper resistance protein D